MTCPSSEKQEFPEKYGNFDRIVEPFSLDSAAIRVAKWKSRKTGLTVVWADVEGPLVNGYFTVATEIFNDSGVPHTLEHLIFLGSEKYPYKGILDSLANRAFATGTNAWTETTHTAYTVTTAGYDGFLRLLPVYLDHILYATITDHGFITEVHHINGEGEDAGVVYSEMQGRENSSGDLMALRNQQVLYPPTSAYRSETGGLMSALRVLTVQQIRDYHSHYYRPHNIQIIVTGKVDPTALLKVLQDKVEPSLVQHGQDKIPVGWKRPFLETASKGGATLTESKTIEVEFPEKDESSGEAQISWVGPGTNDFLRQTALDVITTYLTDSAISPLSKKCIEIESPLCTDISFASTDAEKTITTVYLSSIPIKELPMITEFLKKTLAEEADSIDMGRLKMVLERAALRIRNQMEVDAPDSLSTSIISNFLYGNNPELVESLSSEILRYQALSKWSRDEWSREFKFWLVDRPSVSILGKPSARLADKLEAETKKRIEDTRKHFQPEGLKKLAERLEEAQKANDLPYPDKFLSDFPIPNLDSIKWIGVQIARGDEKLNSDLQAFIDKKDTSTLPYFVQFSHINSSFLTIHVTLSPTDLPSELFPLIPIYLSSFFSLPIKRKDGSLLSYDEVVSQLDKETVEYDINIGSPISQTVDVYIKVEKSKYDRAIQWLRDLLWCSVFDVDRLSITTIKALQSIPTRKRDGNDVAGALFDQTLYSPDLAPTSSVNLLKQEVDLASLMEKLKLSPDHVVKQMAQLRSQLLSPTTMRISVAGNIHELKEPKMMWLKNFESIKQSEIKKPLLANQVLSQEGRKPSGKVIVMAMPSIESSYAYHVARGPQGFDHPDRASLTVAISVLNAMESYLWKAIRGTGLAYGATIGYASESGHVFLNIYRSPDSWTAFAEAGRVLRDLISKKLKFDELILESAKSSSAYSVAKKVATGPAAAYIAFTDVALKGISQDSSKRLLEKAKDVTIDDVLKSVEKYLLPIFDPKNSSGVVASSATKSPEICEALKNAGYRVEIRHLSTSGDEADHSDTASEGGSA